MARANGAMVSYNDLRAMISTEGYEQLEPPPTSDRMATKEMIMTYINCDISGTYVNRQLVPYNRISKRATPPPPRNQFRMDGSSYSSSADSCMHGSATLIRYHNGSGAVKVGYTIYEQLGGSTVNGGGNWYYTDDDMTIQINTLGVVTAITYCTSS